MTVHVLIVDDSPSHVYALRYMLERHGYQVSVASNGKEGVQVAQELHPDVILMDVVMPQLNGFQATRQLHKNQDTASIPVLMFSSKDKSTDRLWAMRQGAKQYLTKPTTEIELLGAIKSCLSE